MSDYASVVDQARKAFASVERLEVAAIHAPNDFGLSVNLAAMKKRAARLQEQLLRYSEIKHVEVCNYRLLPEASGGYGLSYVSRSLLEYQNLFSQVHDAVRNGPKNKAVIGSEAAQESSMEFAYSYSGSLGVVLLAQSSRDFFEGKLDRSIDALYQVIDIDDRASVRDIAKALGRAVIKRIHDWSDINIKAGFAADVRWNRSDGKQVGEVIERRRMENIVGIIGATSDQTTRDFPMVGVLIGGNLRSGAFHFAVLDGPDYRGRLSKNFSPETEMTLGRQYRALMRETVTLRYATDETDMKHELLSLQPFSPVELPPSGGIGGPTGPAGPAPYV